MPFLPSLKRSDGPPEIFARYPELYGPFSEMSQVLMNGPSPFSPAEREMILAYAAGVAGCAFVYAAHSEVAHAWGIEEGLIDRLVADPDAPGPEPRLRPVLAFVRKLTLTPSAMEQTDTDAVLAAGWDEKALHDAVAITARMCFMQRLVEGLGFTPWSREAARAHGEKRVRLGYVRLYPEFRGPAEH